LINAIRFETSNLQSPIVKNNVLIQLNRVDNDLASRVAQALGLPAPAPDTKYYHSNTTANVGAFGQPLDLIDGLKIGVLATVSQPSSIQQAASIRSSFSALNVDVLTVAESLITGVNQTYSASDAINFDAIIVADGAQSLFTGSPNTTLYPADRPLIILSAGYLFGKPVGALGGGAAAFPPAGIPSSGAGIYIANSVDNTFITNVTNGLHTFKFLDRFRLDQ
jgi:catalase